MAQRVPPALAQRGGPGGSRPGGPGGPLRIESAKDLKGTARRLVRYLKPHLGSLIGIGILLVATTGFSLVNPYLFGYAVDTAIARGSLAQLARLSLIMLGVFLAGGLLSFIQSYWLTIVSQRILRTIRQDVFNHLQTLSLRFFDQNEAGDLMSRITNDVEAINRGISNVLSQLLSNMLTFVGIVVAMLTLSVPLTLTTILILPVMFFVVASLARLSRRAFRETQWAIGSLNAVSEEAIAGVRTIQAFRQEQVTIERFDQASARARKAGTLAETYIALLPPTISAISTLAIAVVVGMGGWLAIRQAISIGVIVSFITYARNFFEPVRSLSNLYNQFQAAMAGAERIFQLLDVRPDITDKPDAIEMPSIQGHVVFDHVHFSYVPGVPVLKDICLEAKPGQTIALVGPTGAGKTTIVNLLSRFYDVDSGRITIDGIDIRDVTQDSLRRQLGIVLQEPFLFSGTIMENIRYGRLDATDEEVIEAARLANADQFIRRLPDGYQTDISERGSNLSEGQRQLIAIARTILANPRILILDEATSSVDTRTEIHLQEALLKLMKGRTSFVIAHRLSTIRHADLVLVVHEGQIIERGTHEELLQKRGFYSQLYMSQFRRLEAIERLVLPAGQDMHRAGPTLAPSGASGL